MLSPFAYPGSWLTPGRELTRSLTIKDAKFIEISAAVRYWEDATVNGKEDVGGTLIPCRTGPSWTPVIELDTGLILNWPTGVEACIHYKVCDAGEYWLLDENKQRIAKWKTSYVPNKILCVGGSGYGDYIIFKVGADGRVVGWLRPDELNHDEWTLQA